MDVRKAGQILLPPVFFCELSLAVSRTWGREAMVFLNLEEKMWQQQWSHWVSAVLKPPHCSVPASLFTSCKPRCVSGIFLNEIISCYLQPQGYHTRRFLEVFSLRYISPFLALSHGTPWPRPITPPSRPRPSAMLTSAWFLSVAYSDRIIPVVTCC